MSNGMSNGRGRYSASGQRGGSSYKPNTERASSSNEQEQPKREARSSGGGRGQGRHHERRDRREHQHEKREREEPIGPGYYVYFKSTEGLFFQCTRSNSWPLTMTKGEWDGATERFVISTKWQYRIIKHAYDVCSGMGYYARPVQSLAPFTIDEVKSLIQISAGMLEETDLFKNVPMKEALSSSPEALTDLEIEILSKIPISTLDDRGEFLISHGRYRLIPATDNYSAYNMAFYERLIKLGGLVEGSQAWLNLKLRTNYSYELMILIKSLNAEAILPPVIKKLDKIAAEWPQSAYQLLGTKLPDWKMGDVPEDAHPAYRMVPILLVSESGYERKMLVQELCDDTPLFTPVISYRMAFRSVLQGFNIPMRKFWGTGEAYPKEMMATLGLQERTSTGEYLEAMRKTRDIIFEELKICCEYAKPVPKEVKKPLATPEQEVSPPTITPKTTQEIASSSVPASETTEETASSSTEASSSAAAAPVDPKTESTEESKIHDTEDEFSERLVLTIAKRKFSAIKEVSDINGLIHCVSETNNPYIIFSAPILSHMYNTMLMRTAEKISPETRRMLETLTSKKN